jgi:hypothetical protein
MYRDYDVCYEKFFTFSINYPIGNPKNPIKIKVERVEEVKSEKKMFTVDTILGFAEKLSLFGLPRQLGNHEAEGNQNVFLV